MSEKYSTSTNVVATTIFYRLDGELGSITVPFSQSGGEMKRLARCGAVIRGIVRDYDSPAVEKAVEDGVLRDLNEHEHHDAERWDGMG